MDTRAWMRSLPLLLLAFALACGPRAPAPGETKERVRIGLAIPSYVHAIAWISHERGYFADEGLAAEVQVMGGSAATIQALVGGSLDFGLAGGDTALKARLAGADLAVLAVVVDRFYHRIISRPDVQGLEALKGKTIGLPFLGGPQEMAVRHALQSVSLSPERDVKLLTLGEEFNRMAALARGEIHATTAEVPLPRIREQGFHVLADLPAGDARFPYVAVVVRKGHLQQRTAQAQGVVRALCRGIAYYKHADNKPQALELVRRHIGSEVPPHVAEESYEDVGPRFLAYPPAATPDSFASVLPLIGAGAGPAAIPDDFIAPGALAHLQKQGACRGADPARN